MGSKENRTNQSQILLFSSSLLTTAILVIMVVLYIIASNPPYQYILLFDAGSSSTKVHLFKFRDYPFRSNGWVSEVAYKKISPAISAYARNPMNVTNDLLVAIDALTTANVPAGRTPLIFLGATAGMRLLQLSEPMQAEAILKQLRLEFQKSKGKVLNEFSDIRIIDGHTEARNSWIAVNYLLDNFGDETGKKPISGKEMVGVLDLGGGSTQIAFIPSNQDPTSQNMLTNSFGMSYNAYIYSHLCYGKDVFSLQYLASLYRASSPRTTTISSPCHLSGQSFQKMSDEIFTKPCITSEYAVTLTGSSHTPPSTPVKLTFQGTGDPETCRQAVNGLFSHISCTSQTCSLNNVYQPAVAGKFKATSAFYYAVRDLDLHSQEGNVSREQLNDATNSFCRRKWADVVKESKASALKYKSENCLDGVYINRLLLAYGFNTSESWSNIQFVEKIKGAHASWALGSAIEFTRQIESSSPKLQIDRIAFIVSVTILVALLLLLIVLLLWLICRSKRKVLPTNVEDL